ncbi:uncharacterized protein LOC134851291 isoform X2 [Symsagittifera roscoffensis]|uniref:uncharacterized protein LOC134851291 isoform X2 n=1 Tax=Symsagittifera roscoffensis TaxID=84072 RepID=UPI00307CB0A6
MFPSWIFVLAMIATIVETGSGELHNNLNEPKNRAEAAANQFGSPALQLHPLSCQKERDRSGFIWSRGHYFTGYNGSDCKTSLYTPKQTTPSLDTSEMRMTKDLGNGSICLERIQIQKRWKDVSNLQGILVELIIEGKLSARGWPIEFERTQTEFLLGQLNLNYSTGLNNILFCLQLNEFNLTVLSSSQMIQIMVWISELPIDYSGSRREPHQARQIIGDMDHKSDRFVICELPSEINIIVIPIAVVLAIVTFFGLLFLFVSLRMWNTNRGQ